MQIIPHNVTIKLEGTEQLTIELPNGSKFEIQPEGDGGYLDYYHASGCTNYVFDRLTEKLMVDKHSMR